MGISDNPWVAAQRFLDKHELPHSYTEEVVKFIEKNTGGVQLGQSSASTYVDPYTGASRYTGSSTSQPATQDGGDPFTGELHKLLATDIADWGRWRSVLDDTCAAANRCFSCKDIFIVQTDECGCDEREDCAVE